MQTNLTPVAEAVAHAYLPPSGASAWVHCAAWPSMNRAFPQGDTQETLDGGAAHWAFFEMLYARPVALGQVSADGIALSDEMIEAAELFVDVIDADLAACGLDRRYLQVERRIYMPGVHAENWGTPDVWFYDQRNGRIYVYDFKFGHKFVDAYENWQCIDYAAGILESMNVTGIQDQHIGVDVVVVQPRNYDRSGPVRRWSVVASDLRAHFNRLRNAAEAAMRPSPESKVGEHCEYCPGRHACNTLQRAAYAAAHKASETLPVNLPAAALGLELRMLERAADVLKSRISGLQSEAEARIRRGERVPGYALADTYGREKWRDEKAVASIAQALNVNIMKPALLTPKQAIKAGLNADVVKAYVETPKSGVKLVVDDGTRAAKVFGKTY